MTLLKRGEIPAARHEGEPLDVVRLLSPAPRHERQDLPRECHARRWHGNAGAKRQQLVLHEDEFWIPVAVAPRAVFLDDPRGQAGGRVVQVVPERLRFRSLNRLIASFIGRERIDGLEPDFLWGETDIGLRGVRRLP